MNELSNHELLAVDGGGTCWGFWIGTTDMKYGTCVGYYQG